MIILHEPLVRCEKLQAEGDKLQAEGDKLWGDGYKLWAEGEKLYAEGDKLRAEGDKLRAEGLKLWAEGGELRDEGVRHYHAAVKDFFGEDILINWWTEIGEVKVLNKERAVMPFGELFVEHTTIEYKGR